MSSYNAITWRLISPQVARLAGITYRQLDWWIRTGLVTCENPAPGTGHERGFTVYDVIAIRAAGDLRKHGASMQAIRKAVDALRAEWDIADPLQTGKMIVIDARVYFAPTDDELWDVLRGQAAVKRFLYLDASELARDTIDRVKVLMAA